MVTYKTFAEALIDNPEDVIMRKLLLDVFAAMSDINEDELNLWKKCDPADYCMTVEKFLADGHHFVGGDIFIGIDGDVIKLESDQAASVMNAKEINNEKRHILRAAALEEKPEQYGIGFKKNALNCVIEGNAVIDNDKPEQQTKTVYELVDMPINDIAKAMIDGEVFYGSDGVDSYRWNGKRFVNGNLTISVDGTFYRKVKRPVEWHEDVIDYFEHLEPINHAAIDRDSDVINISGYISKNELEDLARIILKL